MPKLSHRLRASQRNPCVNSVTSLRKRRKTGGMTRIVLFISFIILAGRLLFVLPGAFQHHQDKKASADVPLITQPAGKE